ncbi:hypothetical protein B0O41_2004 [Propionibacteriaceae bacterium ES.041]|nr:hypothetical protein B0O41_2004 [Propionibacteriaceae bacterium ES.041]
MSELLQTYLQDHHAGATSGVALFQRVAKSHGVPEIAAAVQRLSTEVESDKNSLEALMVDVGVRPSVVKDGTARVAELAGQIKTNQRLRERSPLSDLLELEALTAAVFAKRLGWATLLELNDPRLPRATLENLLARADAQGRELEQLHRRCASVLHQS